jgi:chemotaxis signal transduction protein
VPVYSLAALLGYPAVSDAAWIVLCGGGEPVGFAVAELVGHFEVKPDAIRAGGAEGRGRHVREFVSLSETIGIVDLGSVCAEINRRVGAAVPTPKEH